MDANDPRHGTKAGRSQHYRDGEDACDACKDADNIAGRRRRKRKDMGHIYRREVGTALHRRLVELRERGASYQQIADAAGVSFSQVWRPINEGPRHRINASTWLRLNDMPEIRVVTLVGITRRLQALHRLGYSTARICAEIGMTVNGIKPLREGTIVGPINRAHRDAIVDLYNRWQMVLPETDTVSQRKSVTRTKNYAARMGWPPPLAWDDIDDPDERPTGWEYVSADRRTNLLELDAAGASISTICARLHVSKSNLEKWCARNDLSDVFQRVNAREDSMHVNRNQFTAGRAA